jgi:hypothetical protein
VGKGCPACVKAWGICLEWLLRLQIWPTAGAPAPLLALCRFEGAAHRDSAGAVPTTLSCASICVSVAGTKGCPPSSFGKRAPCNALVAALSCQPLDAITFRASVIPKGSSNPILTTQIPSTLRYAHGFVEDVDGLHILV